MAAGRVFAPGMSVAYHSGARPPRQPPNAHFASRRTRASAFPNFTLACREPKYFDVHMSSLRHKYADIISRVLPGRTHLSEENGLLFAADVLVGGVFPQIVDDVLSIAFADRLIFVQFLIEYKIRSNMRNSCRLCSGELSGDPYLCKKCIPTRKKCIGCGNCAFIASSRCLDCAATYAFFSPDPP